MFLTQSRQIRCLAVMALAQGLSTNLIEIAWKSHLHMLHPSPAAYSVSSTSPLVSRPERLWTGCKTLLRRSTWVWGLSLVVLAGGGRQRRVEQCYASICTNILCI